MLLNAIKRTAFLCIASLYFALGKLSCEVCVLEGMTATIGVFKAYIRLDAEKD